MTGREREHDEHDGQVYCLRCQRWIWSGLFAAHQRRDDGLDYFSQREPAPRRKIGNGSRSRDTTEGRRAQRSRWRRRR
jgi:hypothetical protein